MIDLEERGLGADLDIRTAVQITGVLLSLGLAGWLLYLAVKFWFVTLCLVPIFAWGLWPARQAPTPAPEPKPGRPAETDEEWTARFQAKLANRPKKMPKEIVL